MTTMTDEPIDAVWERLWTATYPVFETRGEPAFTARLMAAVKAELAAVLRERERETWERAAKECEQTDIEGNSYHWSGDSVWESDAEATLTEAAKRIRALAPPPAPGAP